MVMCRINLRSKLPTLARKRGTCPECDELPGKPGRDPIYYITIAKKEYRQSRCKGEMPAQLPMTEGLLSLAGHQAGLPTSARLPVGFLTFPFRMS